MDCPYCFENKKNITITKEIEDNLISFIDKNTPNEGSLNISWFGGEPLLQKDLIYRLSKKIKLLCKNKNINYKSNIVTNGVLLDYETAKYLKNECEVGFAQITIDGLKETHDKRRCLKNGQSSFDIIINNIEKIQEFFNVQIRINIDKDNIEESIELIKFFKQRHWNKNIQYYFAPVQETDNYDSDMCMSNSEIKKMQLYLLKKYYEESYLEKNSKPFFKPALTKCLATRYNSYFINADGNVFKCPNHVNDKSKIVFNISQPNLLSSNHVKWLSNIELNEQCKQCKLLPLCQGGCPKNKLENNKTICEYENIDSFKEILKLYYETLKND